MDDILEAQLAVEAARRRLDAAVARARADGEPWVRIGASLGITRQAAFKRFGHPSDPPGRSGIRDRQVAPMTGSAAEQAIGPGDRGREDRRAIASLTPRERDVLALLANGLASQAVTERLHITLRTERNHMANILAKLGVHSQLQAVLLALRYGVIEIA